MDADAYLRGQAEAESKSSAAATSAAHSRPSPQRRGPAAAESNLWPKVPKTLLRQVGRAVGDHAMIKEGDRLLLGLSGGKDSLTLLHALYAMQKRAPIRFEIAACTIDPQSEGFDPSPLKAYTAALGVPYFYESDAIMERAAEQDAERMRLLSNPDIMKRLQSEDEKIMKRVIKI